MGRPHLGSIRCAKTSQLSSDDSSGSTVNSRRHGALSRGIATCYLSVYQYPVSLFESSAYW